MRAPTLQPRLRETRFHGMSFCCRRSSGGAGGEASRSEAAVRRAQRQSGRFALQQALQLAFASPSSPRAADDRAVRASLNGVEQRPRATVAGSFFHDELSRGTCALVATSDTVHTGAAKRDALRADETSSSRVIFTCRARLRQTSRAAQGHRYCLIEHAYPSLHLTR